MNFPDTLPEIIFYRCGKTSRPALPRRPVKYLRTSGATNAAEVCPQIPLGCTGWRADACGKWRPLSELPKEWMPFLNKMRPGPMDPRQALEVTK